MPDKFVFYVYAYIRDKDSIIANAGTPYYIGKGKGRRAFKHHGSDIKVPKNSNQIVFLETNLSEIGALAIERRLILWYGRVSDNTGILRNIAEGGQGCTPSVITKQKISNSLTGRKARPFTEDHRKNLSESLIGRTRPEFSDEWKKAISDSCKGKEPFNKNKICWNNGIENRYSETSPGSEWKQGMMRSQYESKGSRGMSWWNNGETSKLCEIPPDETWKKGRLKLVST